MQLPDLKELTKLIALCRKQGVAEISVGEIRLVLSDIKPVKSKRRSRKLSTEDIKEIQEDEEDELNIEALDREALLMWSVNDAADQIGNDA